jgi:hypothetical protein
VPKPGARVIAPIGEAKVIAVDPARKIVSVKRNDGTVAQLPLDEVAEVAENDHNGKT